MASGQNAEKPGENSVPIPEARNAEPGEEKGTEIQERVKILRRFRELLQTQRDRFRQYLEVLEKQKDLIEDEWAASSGNQLEAQVDLETRIVEDIFAIQKVIDPLEAMYRNVYPEQKRQARNPEDEDEEKKDPEPEEIPELKFTLEELKNEALLMVERNKALLSRRMEETREEIKKVSKGPHRMGRSVYGEAPEPSLIDIEG